MSVPLPDDVLEAVRAELSERLLRLREEIDRSKGVARSERIGQYAGEVYDRGEESSVDAAAEVSGALIDQQEAELRAVRLAIGRIDDGVYGDCVECGGPVGEQRLRVSPAAARCIACQERTESA